MPIKEIENIIIEFKYRDSDYVLDKYKIYDNQGNYIAKCDFTGTNWYGDKLLMEFAAKMVLNAYYLGEFVGEEKGRSDVQFEIKNALGLV